MKVEVSVDLDDLDFDQVDKIVLARLKEVYIDQGRDIENFRTGNFWVHEDDFKSAKKRIPMLMNLIDYFSLPGEADEFFELNPVDWEDYLDEGDCVASPNGIDPYRIELIEDQLFHLKNRIMTLEVDNIKKELAEK